MVNRFEGGHDPRGKRTILWEAQGRVALSKGKALTSAPGRMIVAIDPQSPKFLATMRRVRPHGEPMAVP